MHKIIKNMKPQNLSMGQSSNPPSRKKCQRNSEIFIWVNKSNVFSLVFSNT